MSEREWKFYILDMIDFANNVLSYSNGFSQDEFESSGLNYDATVRNLELIGEAATNIPTELKCKQTEIPWRQIIATRNQLIHGYLGIDNDMLWDIIKNEIPELIEQLESLKDSL